MIYIKKTIKVKADYHITSYFNSVDDLLYELKLNYGYEGGYDQDSQEFIDVLNDYFDEPMAVWGSVGTPANHHRIDKIEVDTQNFETHYTF